MDGKGLTCTTRDWQTPNRIDSCRNQAITTHDSGLAGLGSGGVTGYAEVILMLDLPLLPVCRRP